MKFGKRLSRNIMIMPLGYREELFLDYNMLKGHIKLFVKARRPSFSDDEPEALPVSGLSHEHGWESESHQNGGTTSQATDCGLEDIQGLYFDDALLFGPQTMSDALALGWPSTGMAYGIEQDLQPPMPVASERVQGQRELDGLLEDNVRQPLNYWSPTVVVEGRLEELGRRLQNNLRQPPNWNSALEGLRLLGGGLKHNAPQYSPAEEDAGFMYELSFSIWDGNGVHVRYQVTLFKRRLNEEFAKINKLFVARLQQNSELMVQLELMRREEEAKQQSLHPSSSVFSWDARVLKRLRWRMANLYVDFWILEYSSIINYEASIKVLKKHDKNTGSKLWWNYLPHVQAQDFHVLQSQFYKYAQQCRDLMHVSVAKQLPMSAEEYHQDYAPLIYMCRLMDDENYLVRMEQSSNLNAQSLHSPIIF